ncbi:MAG: bifunctional 2-C-methyl-D-erythritol 4-phosphate cytidylyltransferase/2-C-methyl-D-erythritol 2,4-cyclodiphosphate synthase [Alphaproteobacteria bacterium]|jgi:2-C-methyl-D-erythritol 4-phosphate cytidylyltransferase/2-C-methyl-D-erythritol 2,4-cyclodiphosphate synthase
MVKCAVLIVAAGRGHRFGGEMPKQYRMLAGRPVLRHSLGVFCAHPAISSVRAVIHPDDMPLYAMAAEGLPVLPPVSGGATRQDSVRLGLESLREEAPDIVLIHDGARPFVDFGVITRAIRGVSEHQGAVPALPVTDTIKAASGRNGLTVIEKTVDRTGLWRVQTPQAFPYAEIRAAHEKAAGKELTDDACVAEENGMRVILVGGAEENFKITTSDDLRRAEERLSGRKPDIRTATGFDVHAFEEGSFVTLCGVRVPHDKGLKGHSDADVALHALTDALLGAIGSGDIGLHFPPSEMKWKGADSGQFLRHAVMLARGLNAEILNADVTLIGERPKIGPHRLEMTERLAALLDIPAERVSVKATTTEQLGFTGRREGLAAQACVTVRL